MPNPLIGLVAGGLSLGGAALQASAAKSATKGAVESTERTAEAAEELNRERFGEAQALMQPSIARSETASQQMMAELGLAEGGGSTAYMNAPGYQDLLSESLGAVEQTAASSGSTLYGGRRLAEAGKVGGAVQQSYYTNYMNMLQNMASPQPAANLASLGVGQGITMGGQNIAATSQANQYNLQGTAARNAAIGDVIGGGANLMSGAMMGGYL